MPEKWAVDPTFPVTFDAKFNEYTVVCGADQRGKAMMHYCFSCGGLLPESKRGTFFTEPSAVEMGEVKRIMEQVRDSKTMRAILGEPDYESPRSNDEASLEHARIYNVRQYTTQYTYNSRWQTLSLFVQEQEDGSVRYFLAGKYKGETA